MQDSGGVSRILSVKLNYLIDKYHYEIFVINTNQNNLGFFYEFNSQIKFFVIDTKQLFNYKKELNVLIDTIEPDIILNCDNGLKGSLLPYLITRKMPLIYERHCSRNISASSLFEKFKLTLSNWLLQMSINSYKYFIVLNEEEKNDWKSVNIQVLSNPLWFSLPKSSNKKDSKIVIAVGRHSYEKGYDKLILIWELVVKTHPDWVLKIYGYMGENLLLKRMVSDKNLESNIQFYDPIDNVEKIYSEASMLLSTSESEAFGLVLIEAMAFGKPVIAFDGTSGTKTIIQNKENGFLVKENDMDAFVEKVNLLIGDKNLRYKMGEKAKSSIEKYNLNKIMKHWDSVFKSLY